MQIFDNKILVLLSIPQKDTETIDNIYAVSDKGNIIWRSESLKQLYPDQINLPYEYMTVNGSEIEATDFYGRRYFINIKDGRIIKRDVVKIRNKYSASGGLYSHLLRCRKISDAEEKLSFLLTRPAEVPAGEQQRHTIYQQRIKRNEGSNVY